MPQGEDIEFPRAADAEQGAVGKIIGAALVERDDVFIDDLIGAKFFSAGGTAAFLLQHELSELDPG